MQVIVHLYNECDAKLHHVYVMAHHACSTASAPSIRYTGVLHSTWCQTTPGQLAILTRSMCRVEQQRFQSEMNKLQHALEAKEAQMQRVVSGTGQVSALKQHYDRVLTDLSGERDLLQADRTRLLQVSAVPRTHLLLCTHTGC